MQKITKEILENASPGDIIASGTLNNSPDEVYLSNFEGAKPVLKWVAVRGEIPDWCVYTENCYDKGERDNNLISRIGDKLGKGRLDFILETDKYAYYMYRL